MSSLSQTVNLTGQILEVNSAFTDQLAHMQADRAMQSSHKTNMFSQDINDLEEKTACP